MSSPEHVLRIAVCIFPAALSLDFIGPHSILDVVRPSPSRSYAIQLVILGDSPEPIRLSGGVMMAPEMTYDAAQEPGQKWDAVLVPGGGGARPWHEGNKRCVEFLKAVVPTCEYVMTVCTGSWLLASTGLLRGQRATTNKAAYAACVEHNKDQGVEWVPSARYVVSGRFWTASGVTAGQDMAAAFVRHYVGLYEEEDKAKEVADHLLGVTEVIESAADVDPWSRYYNLA